MAEPRVRKRDSKRRWKARYMLGRWLPFWVVLSWDEMLILAEKNPVERDYMRELFRRKPAACLNPA